MKKLSPPLTKLNQLANGKEVICSDADLDVMCPFDISNVIRSRPNPNQIGTLDRWICWIEFKDMKRVSENGES